MAECLNKSSSLKYYEYKTVECAGSSLIFTGDASYED